MKHMECSYEYSISVPLIWQTTARKKTNNHTHYTELRMCARLCCYPSDDWEFLNSVVQIVM